MSDVNDHDYLGELRSGASCQFVYRAQGNEQEDTICARQAMEHRPIDWAEYSSADTHRDPYLGAKPEPIDLSSATTRELLEELNLRGRALVELDNKAGKRTDLGANGAILAGVSLALMDKSLPKTLEAHRGE